jgi:hypothetical protein
LPPPKPPPLPLLKPPLFKLPKSPLLKPPPLKPPPLKLLRLVLKPVSWVRRGRGLQR